MACICLLSIEALASNFHRKMMWSSVYSRPCVFGVRTSAGHDTLWQNRGSCFWGMQRDRDDLDKLIGKSLGSFRVVERIGAGGMATVFKAYQPTLDRYVAIKVLPAYHAQDPVFVKRFEQEARSVAKLAHPNIVQIHDFGDQDTVYYIVMEFVDGGTLKDRLKKPLPFGDAAYFMIQAAEGLDCAHRNGIVHR